MRKQGYIMLLRNNMMNVNSLRTVMLEMEVFGDLFASFQTLRVIQRR